MAVPCDLLPEHCSLISQKASKTLTQHITTVEKKAAEESEEEKEETKQETPAKKTEEKKESPVAEKGAKTHSRSSLASTHQPFESHITN